MLKTIMSPMKAEFPMSADGSAPQDGAAMKEVEIYISPPPLYPPIRTEGGYSRASEDPGYGGSRQSHRLTSIDQIRIG